MAMPTARASADSWLQSLSEYEQLLATKDTHFQEPESQRQRQRGIFLNHGAFGDPYESTLKLRYYLTRLCYQQPMVYHRDLIPPLVAKSRQRATDFLRIDDSSNVDSFSFTNVRSALFAVIQSVQWKKGDVVVTSDVLYHAVNDALAYLQRKHELEWIIVDTPHGAKSEDIFGQWSNTLVQHRDKQIRLAIVDHISSKPTILFPVEKICRLCQSLSIPILVDGAHVPGSIPSRFVSPMTSYQPTFYTVTFHKWCNVPRGGASGGLWVNVSEIERQAYSQFIDISYLVVKGGWAEPKEGESIYYDGISKPGLFTDGLTQGIYDESTREYENILVLPHCLDLVIRFEGVFGRHSRKLREATLSILPRLWSLDQDLVEKWLGDTTQEYVLPMLSIPLPTTQLLQAVRPREAKVPSMEQAMLLLKKHLAKRLWDNFDIEVPIFCWKNDLLATRISFGRHVSITDIERLGNAVNQIIHEGIEL